MKLRTVIGRAEPQPPEDDGSALRKARIEAARRNSCWTEVEGTVLVRRERWLVHADSDELLTSYRGDTFLRGSASLANDRVPLLFCVDDDGDLAFFEKVGSPRTWSEVVDRRERRRAQKART